MTSIPETIKSLKNIDEYYHNYNTWSSWEASESPKYIHLSRHEARKLSIS
jgi:hypothetical protein